MQGMYRKEFNVGDLVMERAFRHDRKIGSVREIYEFAGEPRCVVVFDDGTESVFFAFELIAAITSQ